MDRGGMTRENPWKKRVIESVSEIIVAPLLAVVFDVVTDIVGAVVNGALLKERVVARPVIPTIGSLDAWDRDRFWIDVLRTSESYQKNVQECIEAVRRVEKKAKVVYEINNNGDLESGRMYYRWDENTLKKLAEQGCFMLVTALSYLKVLEAWPLHHGHGAAINGGSSHQRTNDEQIRKQYVLSMFHLNNQFPIVILKQLMKTDFFRKELNLNLKSVKTKRPTELLGMVLFDVLVQKNSWVSKLQPPTLLYALYVMVIGKVPPRDYGNDNEEWWPMASATDLMNKEITFRSNEGKGIRGIRFSAWMKYYVCLYLPSFSWDHNTMNLFKILIAYEEKLYGDRRYSEVLAYLKFMSELIRTPADARTLALSGIVVAEAGVMDNELPDALSKLIEGREVHKHNLHGVQNQIRSYVKPSKWKNIMILVLIQLCLSLVQTIINILSYQKH